MDNMNRVNGQLFHTNGWVPDLPDKRDLTYKLVYGSPLPALVLPASVDLRVKLTAIENQGQLGSCTAFASCAAFEAQVYKQTFAQFSFSKLFQYYNTRKIENTVDIDNGASIRNSIKALNQTGVCLTGEWPYTVSKFKSQPAAKAYDLAKETRLVKYLRVDNRSLNELKQCLAEGFPIVFGACLYEGFEKLSARFGMALPNKKSRMVGGHAMVLVGYNATHFIVRNSWGTDWGSKGYHWMPFAYITDPDLCDDFWTLRETKTPRAKPMPKPKLVAPVEPGPARAFKVT